MDVSGKADVSTARNESLTAALSLRRPKEKVLVLIDDDMVFSVEQYDRIVADCMEHGGPVSACYVRDDSQLAFVKADGKWLGGLGFFACPFELMEDLAQRSPRVALEGGSSCFAFTHTGPMGEAWVTSDIRLCYRLGGVKILPWGVGHAKYRVLVPTEKQIQAAAT